MKKVKRGYLRSFLVFAVTLSACGIPTSVPSSPASSQTTLTTAQSNDIALSISKLAVQGMGSAGTYKPDAKSVQCNSTGTSCTIFEQLDQYSYDGSGGYIHLSGDITGNFVVNGFSSLQFTIFETLNNWHEGNLLINGSPYLTLTGIFSFLNGVPSTQQTMSLYGGIYYGTYCYISLTINFPSAVGSASLRGTICGNPVSMQF